MLPPKNRMIFLNLLIDENKKRLSYNLKTLSFPPEATH